MNAQDAVQTVLDYHRETNHSVESLRASAHTLDFSILPRLYKLYRRAETVPLPEEAAPSAVPALSAIAGGVPTTGAAPTLEDAAALLKLSAGITKWLKVPNGRMAFRAASCTGALYHIELYLVCGDLPGLPAGVYQYGAQDNALRRVRSGDYRGALAASTAGHPAVASAPVSIVYTSVFWRNAWKYESRAYRHSYWDGGTILANTMTLAGARGLPAHVVTGFVDADVNRIVDVDGVKEAAVAIVPVGSAPPVKEAIVPVGSAPPVKEAVVPVGSTPPVKEAVVPVGSAPPVKEAVVPVGSAPPVKEAVVPVDSAPPFALSLSKGPAPAPERAMLETLPYSPVEVDYPLIRKTHEATSLDAAGAEAWRAASPPAAAAGPSPPPDALSAETPLGSESIEQVILRRGSTRRFQEVPISAAGLRTMLAASMGAVPGDWPAVNGGAVNDLYLIVNAVDGLAPGGYVYHAHNGALEMLRSGEHRMIAGHLGLNQALAHDAAVNCYFLSDLDAVLSGMGARGYRAAQLDASLRAGRLYLSAYALGLGATGLTFFDDEVTQFFSPHATGKSVMFLTLLGVPQKRPRPSGE